MPFPKEVREEALVASGRHCCLCHHFCGIKIEVHHITPEGKNGADTFDNAIPLCFNCHADMLTYDPSHPKGTKYSENELRRHRDSWYAKIKNGLGVVSRSETIATDTQIYQLITKILQWDECVDYVRSHQFAHEPFDRQLIKPLWDYQHYCNNPAVEFLDPDLESLRVMLLHHIDRFRAVVGQYTFPHRELDYFNYVPDEWKTTKPELFDSVKEELHGSADAICETYTALTKLATRKLGILPSNSVKSISEQVDRLRLARETQASLPRPSQ